VPLIWLEFASGMKKMTGTVRHRASESRALASIAAALFLFLTLGGCETTGLGGPSGSAEDRAEQLARSGDHGGAAGAYMDLAVDAAGNERIRYTLLAVEQYLDAGDVSRARSAFRSVARPAQGDLAALWTTNQAAFHLYNGEADAALQLLEPLSRQALAQRDRLRVEALRMMQRETWVGDGVDVERNRARLWQGLLVSDPQVLRGAADLSSDPIIRGWLTIGSLAASTGQQGVGWSNGLVRWREQHAGHPAMSILGSIDIPEHLLLEYPRQIALLLPLSGNAATAGRAIPARAHLRRECRRRRRRRLCNRRR
jgi:outer membrane PBP1 activator LpoA protein